MAASEAEPTAKRGSPRLHRRRPAWARGFDDSGPMSERGTTAVADTPAARPAGRSALGRVYGNAGKLLGGKAAAGLISVIYLGMATRELGPANYGVLVLIMFFVQLVSGFCNLQGWHTLVRYGSATLLSEQPAAFQRLFAFTAFVELGSGLAAMLLTAALARSAGHWFGWPDQYTGLAALYALAIFANMHNTPSGALNLFGRFDLLSMQQLANPLVRLVGATIAWFLHGGLPGFLIAWLMGAIAEGAIDWYLTIGELRRRGLLAGLWRWPAGVTAEHPGIWRFLLFNNLDIALTNAGGRITPLIVGAVLNPAAVGLYHLALRLGTVLQQPVLALGRTVYPELAVLAARGEERALHRLVLRTGAIAMAAGLLVTLIYLLFGTFLLRAIAGPGFEGAKQVLVLIALAGTIQLLGFPFASALVALGRPNITLRVNFAALLLLLPLLYGFLLVFGVNGAGLYSVVFGLSTVGAMAWLLLRPHPAAAA
ncbi:MAG: lipopolysaccharide biosynthesis protein [Nevskia sp.]